MHAKMLVPGWVGSKLWQIQVPTQDSLTSWVRQGWVLTQVKSSLKKMGLSSTMRHWLLNIKVKIFLVIETNEWHRFKYQWLTEEYNLTTWCHIHLAMAAKSPQLINYSLCIQSIIYLLQILWYYIQLQITSHKINIG